MSVIRVKHQTHYVVIQNNTALIDPNLSFKAKGIWSYAMSRPDDWSFNVKHLSTVSKEGIDSIYSGLKELEDQGYLRKIQSRDKGKYASLDYEIHEFKLSLPQRDFPYVVFPDSVNPALLSNEKELSNEPTKKETSYASKEKPDRQNFSHEKEELALLAKRAREDLKHEYPIDIEERKKMLDLMETIKIGEKDGTVSELTEAQKMQILKQYNLPKLKSAVDALLSLLMKGKEIKQTIPFFFSLLKNADPVKDECLHYLRNISAKYGLKMRIGDCFICDHNSRDMIFTGKSLDQVKKEFYEIFLKPIGV